MVFTGTLTVLQARFKHCRQWHESRCTPCSPVTCITTRLMKSKVSKPSWLAVSLVWTIIASKSEFSVRQNSWFASVTQTAFVVLTEYPFNDAQGLPSPGATLFTYSSLAQLVEQRTVNPLVAGSSPAGGAIWDSSLRGRSTGLKNRRMKVRHLPVPPLGAIDESAKSPASQAGGCEFKPHWHHQP